MALLKNRIGALKLSALTAIAFLSMLPPSSASASNLVLDSFAASPSPIDAGGASTWTLGFSLNSTNTGEQFSSASLSFTSGDGQTTSFSGALTGTSASLGEAFTYANAGTYFGSVSGTVVGSWTTNDAIYGTTYGYVSHTSPNCWFNCTYWTYEPVWYGVVGYTTTSHAETFNISGNVQGQLGTSWNTSYSYQVWDYAYVSHTSPNCWFNCTYWTYEPVGSHWETVVTPHTQTLSFNGLTVNSPQIATAVPEPETYAMLLGGLGLLSFIARRRKQSA